MAVVVTLDGQLHDPQAPFLHADDLAAVRGDGAFETLLVRDGRPCLLESHLGRLAHSAQVLDLAAPDLPRWRSAVAVAVQRWLADGTPALDLQLAFTDEQVETSVADTEDNLSLLTLIEVVLPIVGLVGGPLLLVVGFLMMRRPAARPVAHREREVVGAGR